MRHLDLFSGIGGFALAAREVWGEEYENVLFCDNNKFCQSVLRKNFGKDIVIYDDIKNLHFDLEGGIIVTWEKNGIKNTANSHESIGENIITATKKNASPIIKHTAEKNEKKTEPWCCQNTEIGAPAVEKQQETSSPLTTKRIMGILKEKDTVSAEHIETLSKEDSQKNTKSCVGTAICQKESTEYVHIKEKIDLLTAGVPCQPASQAGKRRGTADDRWLWPETFRIIREAQPRFVILENVRGILTLEQGVVFKSLLSEMEDCGYETRAYIIPAVAVNAPHRRDRVWIVARNTNSIRRSGTEKVDTTETRVKTLDNTTGRCGDAPDTESRESGEQTEREWRENFSRGSWNQNWIEVATELCGVDDGLPAQMDGATLTKAGHRVERLKALGNAIVPHVATEIMRMIKYVDQEGHRLLT
jgi:DNA (cytosine-5)-methyltransferase 1